MFLHILDILDLHMQTTNEKNKVEMQFALCTQEKVLFKFKKSFFNFIS